MKRLFRTSKSEVNPLPPPPPPSQPPTSIQQNGNLGPGPRQMAGGGGAGGPGSAPTAIPPGQPQHHHHHHHHLSHSEHKPRQGSVTPFPIDMGRETPPPLQQHQQFPAQAIASHQPPPSSQTSSHRGKGKEKGMSSAPSLLEIKRMQEAHDAEKESRRDEWVASQRLPAPRHPSSHQPSPLPQPPYPTSDYPQVSQPIVSPSRPKINEPTSSPEGWSIISGQQAFPSPQPHSNSSTPTVQQSSLYLPPGARPPSPASQLRPGTPTRPSYSSNLGVSQSSSVIPGNPLPPLAYNNEMDNYAKTTPRIGRDRGYSSASGSMRGSDHEGSTHGHSHNANATAKMPIPKPTPATAPRWSPLAYSYQPTDLSSPQPPYPPNSFPAQATPYSPIVEEMSNVRLNGPTPDADTPRAGDVQGRDKEKKKFWGMGWGGEKKEKSTRQRDMDARPNQDDSRQSVDWREETQPSSTGHGTTEEDHSHRGRILGLDFSSGRHQKEVKDANASQVETVTAAIQILCAMPDPAFATIYEVCDRINHSSSPESVGKEAAQALRKQFKHGNENERRAAANLWLIMMRNVTAKGFRFHATGKKFLGAVEPILLASPAKPVVSPQTHRMIADILSDLTYHFGQEKGSEALIELWRKVKLPQEPDNGTPLPHDFQAFTPDNFYTPRVLGSFDSAGITSSPSSASLSNSRRPSSPNLNHLGVDNRSVPPPIPQRGPSPLHMVGPGYASLPSHGDDIRRLVEESTAARESARVLSEALVYTRPQDLDSKPIIKEFYRKCFLAHESLTNQIDWAQAEANQSRERAIFEASMNGTMDSYESTVEEDALAALFEAHSMLAEALKHHDDMERLARDEQELKEVRERSRKETRMDRNQQGALDAQGSLSAPDQGGGASSSRTPSPAPPSSLPLFPSYDSSPQQDEALLLPSSRPRPVDSTRSRTPSPDRLPHPRIPGSPARASSPLGQSVLAAAKGMRGPRPLPIPFMRGQNASQQSLGSSAPRDPGTNPSRSGTGSTADTPHEPNDDVGADGGDEDAVPHKPSRKALGKRRAIDDPDNHFDPDDMFATSKKSSEESSEESITADDVYLSKPVRYAYDAYQEKIEKELSATATATAAARDTRSRSASQASLGGGGSGAGGGSGGMGSAQRMSLATPVHAT